MSSFKCAGCGADIIDTTQGWVTGCKHYTEYTPDVAIDRVREYLEQTNDTAFVVNEIHAAIDYAVKFGCDKHALCGAFDRLCHELAEEQRRIDDDQQ